MAQMLPSQLVHSVMGKLYDVLTNGDDDVPISEDNFFSWATPGMPVTKESFEFLTQGLTGVVKQSAIEELNPTAPTTTPATGTGGTTTPAPAVELTPALLAQLRAEDTSRMYMQAENWARLVDCVVDVTRVDNDHFARLNVLNNEGSLSDVYRYILRMSQVMRTELPEETKKRIEEFRALLTVTKTKKNLIDGSETKVVEPSPLVQLYFQKMAAYEDAVLEYNSHRIDALTASTPQAVHYWAMNAKALRNKVRAAMADWVSSGYKDNYEAIAAFVDQVMQRDMALLKAQFADELDQSRLTGLSSGQDFFYTSMAPADVMESSGWTRFTFNSGDFSWQSDSNYSTNSWAATAGGTFFGIFGGGGFAGGSSGKTEFTSSFDSDSFSLSFEIAQAQIVRQWFKPAFLLSKCWRFDPANVDAQGDMVSDGETPPKGLIPAYPTAVVMIRNLHLSLGHSQGFQSFMSEHSDSVAGGSGGVAFGPIALSGGGAGSSSSGSSSASTGYSYDDQGLSVPGEQIIGFKCHVNPRSPDPSPSITSWI